ncbi:hypothetical protein BOTBODRAFT_66862 [Botryobasidium botryosum FD-172 SS1]|uniref:Anaphase-promoting complex subunit 4 WD40 domain-containing protein n=1 Tax=Botryobasidium botryosum (strain FD-172 SS1) TaxID=930990 RepID=A0A067MPA1_BOTB1|nr:hypothetical protein BOTBODRAFT_66862 [Botryobasidium botryosum FD-172 SS1]
MDARPQPFRRFSTSTGFRTNTEPAGPSAPYTNEPTSYTLPRGLSNDLPGRQSTSKSHKRKLTLLSLLDELEQLRSSPDDELEGFASQFTFDDRREDGATIDARLQAEGAEMFHCFDKRVKGLDKQLQSFSNAVRQLGSSVGLLSSAYHLRKRLNDTLHRFRENAAELFPEHVKKRDAERFKPFSIRNRARSRDENAQRLHTIPPPRSDPEMLPSDLEWLAKDLTTFLNRLNDIPEFTDEAVNASMHAFEGDLKYWASCMKEYEGQFRYPAVERYVNDLSVEMGEHMENVTQALIVFVETGVPTIRFTQEHTAHGLQNLSTVATFFSAVTASMLQYSYQYDQSASPSQVRVKDAVNMLWICSLVFSVAAAINSVLSLHWRAAMYRSPRNYVPWLVLMWITRTPLFFLVASVLAFSAGLVCFTFSNYANIWIPRLTIIWTCVSSFALLAVALWFASERWAFSKTKGRKWLGDILEDVSQSLQSITGINWMARAISTHVNPVVTRSTGHVTGAMLYFARSASSALCNLSGKAFGRAAENGDSSTSSILPTSSPARRAYPVPGSGLVGTPALPPGRSAPDHNQHTTDEGTAATTSDIEEKTQSEHPGGTTEVNQSPARTRFAQIGWQVIRMLRVLPRASLDHAHAPPCSQSPNPSELLTRRESADTWAPRPSRLNALIPILKQLTPTQYLGGEHQALVRHLEFSPNGKFLATCSWDRTMIIWKVGEPFTKHRVLAHPEGFVGQVAWSPNSDFLLCKLGRAIKLWTASGVLRKKILRGTNVQSVAWLPDGNSFVSVEGANVHEIDLAGAIRATFTLERMQIHDVAITHGGQRFVAVATLERSETGLKPIKSQAQKRIIVYNMAERVIENQVPILQEVRGIQVSSNGQLALVSYENQTPPQLWRIPLIRDQARLQRMHTYMPHAPVDFAGHSYFGGKEDQFVICAGKGGETFVWDRETGALLHFIRAHAQASDLTSIAWNRASPSLMFASASHDGAVRIWTTPPPAEAPSAPEPETRTDTFNTVLEQPEDSTPMPIPRAQSPEILVTMGSLSRLQEESPA